MKKIKRLLLNTAVLTGTSLLMRTVGISFNVYLSNIIGSAGIGLFELVMSVYMLAVSLAASGIRLSTTRLVVEAATTGQYSEKSAMRICLRYSLILGCCAAVLLFAMADFIATTWLSSQPTAISLKILSISLPFISASACLNGYFTAARRAAHFAGVQVGEQLARIGITVYLLRFLAPMGMEYACVALVIGSCSAEALSLAASMTLYKLHTRRRLSGQRGTPLLGKLLTIAVPDAVGSWVRSALVTAKHLLIPVSLRRTGVSVEAALASYGTVHGMVLPILTYPSALLGALSSLLVPEVAESRGLNHDRHVKYIIDRVLHMTLLFSIAVAGVLFCFAEPLGEAIYPGKGTQLYIRLLAPVIPIMYLDMTVDGMLKGLGLQLASMRYNIIDAAMSLTLVCALIPRVGIWGYIFTIYASEILNFCLSIGKLTKVAHMRISVVKSVIKPALCIAASGMCGRAFISWGTAVSQTSSGGLIIAVGMNVIFYIVMLMLFGCLTLGDMRWLKSAVRG